MSEEKVILFPYKEGHRIPPPSSVEEVIENSQLLRKMQINEVIDDLCSGLLEHVALCGFKPDGDVEKKHAFLFENIRSTLYSYYGFYHPINDLVDKIITVSDEGIQIEIPEFKKKRIKKKIETE